MRRTSFSTWLLLAALVAAVVASRLGRAFGPAGVIVVVVLVVAGIVVLRFAIEAARARSAGADRGPSLPKNVTPVEPALSPGAEPSTWPPKPEGPSVVVIDPPDRSEQLTAKLQALDALRAEGLVTDDEYERKRAQLIADF